METLEQIFNSSLNHVRLEIQEAKPLDKSYVQALKHLVGNDFEPRDLFFNSSCLITTDIDDAKLLESRLSNCEVIFKVESEYFGFGFYFINFLKNKSVTTLIGGAHA